MDVNNGLSRKQLNLLKNNSSIIIDVIDYLKGESRKPKNRFNNNKTKLNINILRKKPAKTFQMANYSNIINSTTQMNTTTISVTTTITDAFNQTSTVSYDENKLKETNNFASVECNCNRLAELSVMDANLWKSTFFVMAFLILFISFVLILVLGIRLLIFKFKKPNRHNMKRKNSNISNKMSICLFQMDSINKQKSSFDKFKTYFHKPEQSHTQIERYQIKPIFNKNENDIHSIEIISNNALHESTYNELYSQTVCKPFNNNDKSMTAYVNDCFTKTPELSDSSQSATQVSDIDFTNAFGIFEDCIPLYENNQDHQAITKNATLFNTNISQIIPRSYFELNKELKTELEKRRLYLDNDRSYTKLTDDKQPRAEDDECDCTCPCHKQKHLPKRSNSSRIDSAGRIVKSTNYGRTINLPIKRESIRELMRTKVVSENKQKSLLEKHLFQKSLVSSQANLNS